MSASSPKNIRPGTLGSTANGNARKSSFSTRRRSASIAKGEYSVSMPASTRLGAAMAEAEDDDDEEDGIDGEVKSRVRGKRTKKGQEVYQCEKCSKWYRHPACLVKHRWQHTEYWAQTANLMMSKHQSVMLLEAAAILTNGQSLPDEKSLWPAAVSPPTSGLLGSEYLNSDVMRRTTSISSSSPFATSFSQLAEMDPAFNSKQGKKSAGSTDEDDRMSVSMAGDDDENDSSPPTTNGGDEPEEMFSFEMGEVPALSESGSARDAKSMYSAPASGLALRHSIAATAKLPGTQSMSSGFAVPALPAKSSFSQFGMPASAHFAAPAPKLGFFLPRAVEERSTAVAEDDQAMDMEL